MPLGSSRGISFINNLYIGSARVPCDCSDTMYYGEYCEIKPDFCKNFHCYHECNASSMNPSNPCEACPEGFEESIIGQHHRCDGW